MRFSRTRRSWMRMEGRRSGTPRCAPSHPTHTPSRASITGRNAVTSPPGANSQPTSVRWIGSRLATDTTARDGDVNERVGPGLLPRGGADRGEGVLTGVPAAGRRSTLSRMPHTRTQSVSARTPDHRRTFGGTASIDVPAGRSWCAAALPTDHLGGVVRFWAKTSFSHLSERRRGQEAAQRGTSRAYRCCPISRRRAGRGIRRPPLAPLAGPLPCPTLAFSARRRATGLPVERIVCVTRLGPVRGARTGRCGIVR